MKIVKYNYSDTRLVCSDFVLTETDLKILFPEFSLFFKEPKDSSGLYFYHLFKFVRLQNYKKPNANNS